MKEITEKEWNDLLGCKESFAVFVYTPMCGTCKLGFQMLHVIMTMNPEQRIYQCNIQFMKQLQNTFCIESVPCLLLFENGKMINRVYALHSVIHLYELTAFLRNEVKQNGK